MKKLLFISVLFLIMSGCGTNSIPEDPLQTKGLVGGDLKSVQIVLDSYPSAVHT